MAAVVVACSGFCRAIEARLSRGLYEFLIFFQIEHRLLADAGEITFPAADAGLAGQDLAADGKIHVLYAAHELLAPLQISLFDFGRQALLRRIGLLGPSR